jgi:predicted Zn-dependent protease
VHNNLGVALERVGQIEEAKAAYAEASFLSPKYVKAQLNASRIAKLAQAPAIDGGDPEAAIEMEAMPE